MPSLTAYLSHTVEENPTIVTPQLIESWDYGIDTSRKSDTTFLLEISVNNNGLAQVLAVTGCPSFLRHLDKCWARVLRASTPITMTMRSGTPSPADTQVPKFRYYYRPCSMLGPTARSRCYGAGVTGQVNGASANGHIFEKADDDLAHQDPRKPSITLISRSKALHMVLSYCLPSLLGSFGSSWLTRGPEVPRLLPQAEIFGFPLCCEGACV